MTPPESPSALLQRAAELIERTAATVLAPQFWDREIRGADLSESGAAWAKLVAPPAAAPLVAWLRYESKDAQAYRTHDWPMMEKWSSVRFARLVLGVPSREEETTGE